MERYFETIRSNKEIILIFLAISVAFSFLYFKKNDVASVNIESPSYTNQQEEATKKEDSLTKYKNQSYAYSVDYPEGWHMNNDDSEGRIEKSIGPNGIDIQVGGQTFWSNYSNINKYNPDNKPDDFKILSLFIYRDDSKSIDDFASKIGSSDLAESQDIKARGATGKEFVGPGLDEKNPQISAIFQKGDLFYVFEPAFLNSDENAASDMESIVLSFSLEK